MTNIYVRSTVVKGGMGGDATYNRRLARRSREWRTSPRRHTAASIALASGVNVKVISVVAWPRRTEITFDLHSHVLAGQDAAAAGAAATALFARKEA